MPRTTAEKVKAVLAPGNDYDLEANHDLTEFIETAEVVVNDVELNASEKGRVVPEANLVKLETWLAAFFYKGSDLQHQSKNTDGASATFTGKTDKGYDSNYYGQRAMLIDTTGRLAATGGANGKNVASGFDLSSE